MAQKGHTKHGKCLPRLTVTEFYHGLHEECRKKAEKLKEELQITAEDLSRRSPRSQRHGELYRNVAAKDLTVKYLKNDFESEVYKQLWEEANAAVFQNHLTAT